MEFYPAFRHVLCGMVRQDDLRAIEGLATLVDARARTRSVNVITKTYPIVEPA